MGTINEPKRLLENLGEGSLIKLMERALGEISWIKLSEKALGEGSRRRLLEKALGDISWKILLKRSFGDFRVVTVVEMVTGKVLSGAFIDSGVTANRKRNSQNEEAVGRRSDSTDGQGGVWDVSERPPKSLRRGRTSKS